MGFYPSYLSSGELFLQPGDCMPQLKGRSSNDDSLTRDLLRREAVCGVPISQSLDTTPSSMGLIPAVNMCGIYE